MTGIDLKHVTWHGETRTLYQWSKLRGINYITVKRRLTVLGWDLDRTLNLPAQIVDDGHKCSVHQWAAKHDLDQEVAEDLLIKGKTPERILSMKYSGDNLPDSTYHDLFVSYVRVERQKHVKACYRWDSYRHFKRWALAHGWEPGMRIVRKGTRPISPKSYRWETNRPKDTGMHDAQDDIETFIRQCREPRKKGGRR
jgi:hypothetical protein